jgi:Histidine kinase
MTTVAKAQRLESANGNRDLTTAITGRVSRAAADRATDAERRRLMRELQVSRQRLVAWAGTERQRIECDLHDGAQQRLTALSIRIAIAAATSPRAEWHEILPNREPVQTQQRPRSAIWIGPCLSTLFQKRSLTVTRARRRRPGDPKCDRNATSTSAAYADPRIFSHVRRLSNCYIKWLICGEFPRSPAGP